jgi:hypothetical protein
MASLTFFVIGVSLFIVCSLIYIFSSYPVSIFALALMVCGAAFAYVGVTYEKV